MNTFEQFLVEKLITINEIKTGNKLTYDRTDPALEAAWKEIDSKPTKMSGATRTFRKGARRARKTGVGNDLENRISEVPTTFKGMMRRARRERRADAAVAATIKKHFGKNK